MTQFTRKTFTLLMLGVALLFPGLDAKADGLKDFRFDVAQFTTLNIQDNVNVVYHHTDDAQAYASYNGTDDFDDAFIFTSSGNTLRVQVNTEDVGKPGLPTLHVYSNALYKVENGSDFNTRIEDPTPGHDFTAVVIGNGALEVNRLDAAKLSARVTAGNGVITLRGKCVKASYRMTGAGNINGTSLKSESIDCRVFGGGAIECGPTQRIKLMGLGSTKVYYTGNPVLKHTGGGRFIPADSMQ
ncbi:MAG: hypothetical protein HDR80_01265 [Bacteroides sp.]|nr:hypothetical protein [Bacteroides sp.]